jgi:predicted permease
MFWSRCRAVVRRALAVLRKDRLDRDFDEELSTHLELLIDEGRRRGQSPADARREALRKLGRPVALRELHREQRGMPVLDVLAQDLRHAVRALWKSPAFTGIVTLSLALGIGANTALFSLVDGLLLRSLPVREPDRLVQVRQTFTGPGMKKAGGVFSKPAFDFIRAHTAVFSEIVGFNRLDRPAVDVDGVAEPSREVAQVSENFFRDLGVLPIVGRTPEASEDTVAIISHSWWRTRFGGSAGVLGRMVTIDGRACPIIGVAPPRFLGLSFDNPADLWITSRVPPSQQMIARLKPGVTASQAQADMQALFPQLAREQPDVPWEDGMQAEILPAGRGLSQLRAEYERPLLALTVLVTLVLLITCTNVGNLLTVRHAARRRELTVRIALGASRSRLFLQYLVESAVLATLGGIMALVFARWGVSIIIAMLPLPAAPEGLAFHADGRVLAFAAGASLLSALLFGLAPAWRAADVDPRSVLRSGRGTTSTIGTRRLGRWLVGCQVALSVLLLVAAGLFVQTLRNLVRLDMGFAPDRLLQVSVDTRASGYGRGQVGPLYRLLLDRVSAVPGVRSVTVIRNPVLRGALSRCGIRMPGLQLAPDEAAECVDVGPSFFETMNIPVLRGRTFNAADFEQARGFVVISEAFAKRYFPNEDPVGRFPIIGVVRNARLSAVRGESGPMMYHMAAREPDRFNALEVRIEGDPDAIAGAVGAVVRGVNPRLLIGIKSMPRQIDEDIAKERMVAATSACFSLLGLLLVSIGVFGVASSTVAQRTNELGIRMALGAGRWSVIRESLRDTMLVFGAGLTAGIIAAIGAVRLTASFISDLLFGLTATDAANIVGAVVVMVGVALAACILPARHATRIDPLTAIRHE